MAHFSRSVLHVFSLTVIFAVLKESSSYYATEHHPLNNHKPGCPSVQIIKEKQPAVPTYPPETHDDKLVISKNECTCQKQHTPTTQCPFSDPKTHQGHHPNYLFRDVTKIPDTNGESEYSAYITRPAHVINYPSNSHFAPQTAYKEETAQSQVHSPHNRYDYPHAHNKGGVEVNDVFQLEYPPIVHRNTKSEEDALQEVPDTDLGNPDMQPRNVEENLENETVKSVDYYNNPTLINNEYQVIKRDSGYINSAEINGYQYSKQEPIYYIETDEVDHECPYIKRGAEYIDRKQGENEPEHRHYKRDTTHVGQPDNENHKKNYKLMVPLQVNKGHNHKKRETYYTKIALVKSNPYKKKYSEQPQIENDNTFCKRCSEYILPEEVNNQYEYNKRDTEYIVPTQINNENQFSETYKEQVGPPQQNNEYEYNKRDTEYIEPTQINNENQFSKNYNEYIEPSQVHNAYEYNKRDTEYIAPTQINNENQFSTNYNEYIGAPQPINGCECTKRDAEYIVPTQINNENQFSTNYNDYVGVPQLNNGCECTKRDAEYIVPTEIINNENQFNTNYNEHVGAPQLNNGHEYNKRDAEYIAPTQMNNGNQFSTHYNEYINPPQQINNAYWYNKRDTENGPPNQINHHNQASNIHREYVRPSQVNNIHEFNKRYIEQRPTGISQNKNQHNKRYKQLLKQVWKNKYRYNNRDTRYAKINGKNIKYQHQNADPAQLYQREPTLNRNEYHYNKRNVENNEFGPGEFVQEDAHESVTTVPAEVTTKPRRVKKRKIHKSKKKHGQKKEKRKGVAGEVKKENSKKGASTDGIVIEKLAVSPVTDKEFKEILKTLTL